MTPFPYAVELDSPVGGAQQLMSEHGIRHLPVTENRELVGLVTARDLEVVLRSDRQQPSKDKLRVREVYRSDPYVVDLKEPLDQVLLAMAARHIDSAVVTRKGRLAGVFTATDACECFATFLRRHFAPDGGNDAA